MKKGTRLSLGQTWIVGDQIGAGGFGRVHVVTVMVKRQWPSSSQRIRPIGRREVTQIVEPDAIEPYDRRLVVLVEEDGSASPSVP